MQFRYDFGAKLDLSKFEVQAKHYIGQMHQLEYHLVLQHYKLIVEVNTPDNTNTHLVSATIFEIKRDQDKEIINDSLIYPRRDVRFQDLKIIQECWADENSHVGSWGSNSSVLTVEKIIKVLRIVHKINNLQVFA